MKTSPRVYYAVSGGLFAVAVANILLYHTLGQQFLDDNLGETARSVIRLAIVAILLGGLAWVIPARRALGKPSLGPKDVAVLILPAVVVIAGVYDSLVVVFASFVIAAVFGLLWVA
jgi:uncharacterized membrane protein HdeD (DUF308 family)